MEHSEQSGTKDQKMRYAPANWVILHVYKDEKNVLRYRENGLVPKSSWHKPLPYADETADEVFLWRNYLAVNKLVVNTKLHGDVIAANRAPPNTHENVIPLNSPSIDQCNSDIAMLDARFQHGAQLNATRKRIVCELFEKLRKTGKYNTNKAIVDEMAVRICAKPANIATTLKNFGIIAVTKNITSAASYIDKKSAEYRALQKAVMKARNRALSLSVPGTFGIEALLINHADLTSSVPMVCPVLGIQLSIEGEKAHNLMSVWRKDTRSPMVKNNVAVMSQLASRMIEGRKIATDTAIEYLQSFPEAGAYWRRWCESHEVGWKNA